MKKLILLLSMIVLSISCLMFANAASAGAKIIFKSGHNRYPYWHRHHNHYPYWRRHHHRYYHPRY